MYKPFGGTPGAGVYMDLDTTFTGIQLKILSQDLLILDVKLLA